jgi:hypothetical protein
MRFRVLRHLALAAILAACGSRTGLFDGDTTGGLPIDGGRDVGRDTGLDAEPDVLPPIDASIERDANRLDCPDADTTFIYVVTSANELFAFVPPTSQFIPRGTLNCPAAPGSTPFSMAVDRAGVAYVLFRGDERIYRVSTRTAACTPTSYVPRQSNFGLFGMGFATIGAGPAEALFVAGSDLPNEPDPGATGLARIALPSFSLTPVGQFTQPIQGAELTGTGDGRLFGFYTKNDNNVPTFIGEINSSTGAIVAESTLATVDRGSGWAFAFWGGEFYIFHAPGGTSRVTRFNPQNNAVTQVATLPTVIVGAGVSTCAPND